MLGKGGVSCFGRCFFFLIEKASEYLLKIAAISHEKVKKTNQKAKKQTPPLSFGRFPLS